MAVVAVPSTNSVRLAVPNLTSIPFGYEFHAVRPLAHAFLGVEVVERSSPEGLNRPGFSERFVT